jgi:hypothetical protein
MSTRRLLGTVAVMAAVALGLAVLTPAPATMAGALAAAQRTADTQGPDVLISSAAGLLAWAVWAWGALGLALTAASAVPGLVGTVARLALRVALPPGARRAAAVLLGIGLGLTAPLGASALPALAPAAAADSTTSDVPDWPGPPTETPATADRVVVRGDCLWHIAADSLLGQLGRLPSDGEVAVAVDAWWRANADVIGPDPDLLLPGQRLRTPGPS